MKGFYATIREAAETATDMLGFPVATADLDALVALGILPAVGSALPRIRRADSPRLAAQLHTNIQVGGLFDDIPDLFPVRANRRGRGSVKVQRERQQGSSAFILITPVLGISFTPGEIPAECLQVFITLVRDRLDPAAADRTHARLSDSPARVPLTPSVTAWVHGGTPPDVIRSFWEMSERKDATTSYSENLATAKVYGNKARLTSFLVAVAGLYLPPGSYICDLMSGTGIVTLRFAASYRVFANDANPFAHHLTHCRSLSIEESDIPDRLAEMRTACDRNSAALSPLLEGLLTEESRFLHEAITSHSLASYRAFCGSFPPLFGEHLIPTATDSPVVSRIRDLVRERRADPRAFPFCLLTAYFANSYLGLAQAIAADGIRYAIDQQPQGPFRDMCLGALMLAVSTCGSGPHFAQPPKLHSTATMAELVEHRARDLFSEFSMLVSLLAARTSGRAAIEATWNSDWRDGLTAYEKATAGRDAPARGVYIDPPYTKLQYSRYYHVLNTLISYDYPVCEGVGRYPPRESRFSSRFEFLGTTAAREFEELFERCSAAKFVTLVSYSDNGLVDLGQLIGSMEKWFSRVELFTKSARHHSQGKPMPKASKAVTECLLVGVP